MGNGLHPIQRHSIMKHKGILAVLAACAGLAFTGLPVPMAGDLGASKAYADGARKAKGYPKRTRVVRVRGGYYSYVYRDVAVSSWRVNLFFTPMFDLQSPAGPFDSGFFFDPGLRPHWWNNAPYPN
jgi:hypothetical protein